MSVFALNDLEVSYARRGRSAVRAVAGASLSLARGELVGLVGESGCGKSTLAKAAAGLVAASGGSVLLDGTPVAPVSRRARPAREVKLQMVFQDPYSSLNPRRRVGAQIADALRLHDLVPTERRPQRVTELLAQVGLPESAAHAYPHQFSGGQRQRLAIARAIAAEPEVLILDEPLSALDASAQAQVANLLKRLCRDLGIAMLLISHDLAIVRQVADRIAVMYLGVIVENGPTDSLWNDPRHPYTRALIDAIPRADGLGVKPTPLPGEVPDPARPPSGCRFHPRCPHSFDRCRSESPVLETIGEHREAACWLSADGPADGYDIDKGQQT